MCASVTVNDKDRLSSKIEPYSKTSLSIVAKLAMHAYVYAVHTVMLHTCSLTPLHLLNC